MKFKISHIALLALLSISSPLFAAKMTTWSKISQIVIHDWSGVIIYLEDTTAASAEGCSLKDRVLLEPTHYLFDIAYSSALSSLHTNKTVRFFVDSCKPFGSETIPVLKRIDLLK